MPEPREKGAPAPFQPCFLFGQVMHRRLRPVENRFAYRVFCLRLPLSRLDGMRLPGFSVNRWNLLSVRHADHGDGGEPLPWIRGVLAREGYGHVDGEVVLQTFPRVLGYVFNPVSFWLCHDRAGQLRVVVAEVNNTFGERHCYLLARADGGAIGADAMLASRKVFHVSPFFPVEGGYRFRFVESPERGRSLVRIDYHDAEGDLLHTAISGEAAPLDAAGVRRALLRYPAMTLGVMARIHWQALRLWLRRVPFFPKPQPSKDGVTRWAQ